MTPDFEYPVAIRAQPRLRAGRALWPASARRAGRAAYTSAEAQIRSWPGYQPTPLRDLSGLARAVGVAGIRYKDEGGRFGLGSFKTLGGAYAVSRQLLRELAARLGRDDLSVEDLLSGRYRELTQSITVTCATDGNHGRSVAWARSVSAASA